MKLTHYYSSQKNFFRVSLLRDKNIFTFIFLNATVIQIPRVNELHTCKIYVICCRNMLVHVYFDIKVFNDKKPLKHWIGPVKHVNSKSMDPIEIQ